MGSLSLLNAKRQGDRAHYKRLRMVEIAEDMIERDLVCVRRLLELGRKGNGRTNMRAMRAEQFKARSLLAQTFGRDLPYSRLLGHVIFANCPLGGLAVCRQGILGARPRTSG